MIFAGNQALTCVPKVVLLFLMDRFRWLLTYYRYFTGYIPAGEGLVPEVS